MHNPLELITMLNLLVAAAQAAFSPLWVYFDDFGVKCDLIRGADFTFFHNWYIS